MRTNFILLVVAILTFSPMFLSANDQTDAVTPKIFTSETEARQWVEALTAGGSQMSFWVGSTEVMVLYVFGSGVPVIAIAAYIEDDGKLTRVNELYPEQMGKVTEAFRPYVANDALLVVGEKSGNEWVVYSPSTVQR